ncbi:methylmalonyl-CoA epimerase [Aureimonas mangrovi]|uniref:methylmalonyl-CoA epimerase n=1 Tax=Aureimonas mangrovi TaxID=2758041 RepID=UPI00163D3E26|nr:methylmalonyl-CoA epimerase [Aureimonas mangrovi]
MRLGRLNHVGIAVSAMAEARARYAALFGEGAVGEPIDLPAQGVTACFVRAGDSEIELIAPLGTESPLAAFLQKAPAGGQHHLCFEVESVAEAVAALRAEGKRVLGEPRPGAHGTLVAFVHPKDMGGVLTEIMEAPDAHG